MRLLVLGLAVACSALACSDDESPPPRVFIYAQVGPGTDKDEKGDPINDSTHCKLTTEEWLSLGTPTTQINSGTKQSEATVSVTCSVKPEGGAFRVAASAALSGRGSFTISGLVNATGQSKARGSFTRGDTGTLKQEDCTVEIAGDDKTVTKGLISAKIMCPKASQQGGQDRTCLGQADFKFDRCDG